ncbi:Phage portal protein [Vibrio crassostreae]|nr:portal protein [Vibrio phage 187P1]CAK2033222.1 Phage portal protein [Vibrio crassostreae]CAK2913851.1 Phage portal protein [Vibrio crassostreae]CAK2917476.1 Phage portal protein [Vibrio crassostreae]CAK2931684.1 Phage portal protein [Vibrio crassostreae]
MKDVQILHPSGMPARQMAGYEGGNAGFGGQLAEWTPSLMTEDAALLPSLDLSNARSDDLVRNHGYAAGGMRLHLDNIVGHIFKLNWQPMWRRLGWTEDEFMDLKTDVEAAWLEYAEDDRCYIDAERKRTFTMLVRAGICQHFNYGDVMAAAEWIPDRHAGYSTSIKMISPKRVRNPGNVTLMDSDIRGGIKHGRHGQAQGYYVADLNPMMPLGMVANNYRYVSKETWWGRSKFIHVFDAKDDGQSRGTNALMSVMSQMHMLDKLQQTKLQNAIVNAMFAATIESELDSTEAFNFITGGEETQKNMWNWMGAVNKYHRGANIRMNGTKVSHLMPGESLNLQRPSNADNGYSQLEMSILQYISSGIGVSVEQLTHNFQNSNYSSARAALNESWRYFMGDRKFIASRFATRIFSLWLEEAVAKGVVRLPKGTNFWQARSALCRCDWIGSGRLSIDGIKEVKESILLIESGLSTYQKELAKMGEDYIEVFEQQMREMKIREEKGLPRPSWLQAEQFAPEQPDEPANNGSKNEPNNQPV